MSSRDDALMQRLRATFAVEAAEHLAAIRQGLVELESGAGAAPLEGVFRHTHSLKGAAAAVDALAIERECQQLEDVLAACRRGNAVLTTEDFDRLHRGYARIEQLQLDAEPRAPDSSTKAPARSPNELGGAAAERGDGVRPLDTLRVKAVELEQLLGALEAFGSVRQSLQRRGTELALCEPQFEEWRRQWRRIETPLRALRQQPADANTLLEFLDWSEFWVKSLRARLLAETQALQQQTQAFAKQLDGMLDATKQLVTLPFASLAELFPRVVRELAREQGKAVDLQVDGAELALDKRVLDALRDPLLHLLRNAVDHGIETPERRAAQGKPARARLSLVLRLLDGGRVRIELSDDGAGVDLAAVRQQALARGLLAAEAVAALDDASALQLIFRSALSTSPIISTVSGRGLGLAIVREQVERLGGELRVDSRAGQGTVFAIVVPTVLAAARGVVVRVGERSFVLPAQQIERVLRCPASRVRRVGNRETVTLDAHPLSLLRLRDVLQLPRLCNGADWLELVLLRAAGERIALAVDAVVDDEELLLKPLPPPLRRVRFIAGACLLGSGQLAPVLSVGDLVAGAAQLAGRALEGTALAAAPARQKRILLAEDSVTSRMLLRGILEAAGYAVSSAVDGIEAWTLLRSEPFDLLVSDVEMPRLNGFELTARLRADAALARLPVVLVTALAQRADRERGIEVGANAYLVKSDFEQSNLLDVVRRLL